MQRQRPVGISRDGGAEWRYPGRRSRQGGPSGQRGRDGQSATVPDFRRGAGPEERTRMAKFISKRLVQMVILFAIFLTILFFLLEAQPGDLTQQYIGNT